MLAGVDRLRIDIDEQPDGMAIAEECGDYRVIHDSGQTQQSGLRGGRQRRASEVVATAHVGRMRVSGLGALVGEASFRRPLVAMDERVPDYILEHF